MRRIFVFVFLLWLAMPAFGIELAVRAGRGVLEHTKGFGWQINASLPIYPAIRAHLTSWDDNTAATLAYDLSWRGFNFSVGGGWVRRTTNSLHSRRNFYLELGYQLSRHVRCQLVHFSSTKDDNGDNLFLCGLRFTP